MADWYMATRLAQREEAWAQAPATERVEIAKQIYNAMVANEESLTVYPTSTTGKMIEDVQAFESAKRLAREIAMADELAYLEAHAGEDMASYIRYLAREYPGVHPFMGELMENWETYLPLEWYPRMEAGISLAKCLGMDWIALDEIREPLDETDWDDPEEVEENLKAQVTWDPRTDPWVKANEAIFQDWILLILDSWMRWKISEFPPPGDLEDLLYIQNENHTACSLKMMSIEELLAPPTEEDLPLVRLAWKYRPEGEWWMDALEMTLTYLPQNGMSLNQPTPYPFPEWISLLIQKDPSWEKWIEEFNQEILLRG